LIRFLLGRLLMRRMEPANPDARLVAFARGAVLGALVGAAIAGSGLWRKLRGSARRRVD
jgi:hypothetical protein